MLDAEGGGADAPPVLAAAERLYLRSLNVTLMAQADEIAPVVYVVPLSAPLQPEASATSYPSFGVIENAAVAPFVTVSVAGDTVPPDPADAVTVYDFGPPPPPQPARTATVIRGAIHTDARDSFPDLMAPTRLILIIQFTRR